MRTLTDGPKLARWVVVGDVIALLAFLAIGLDRHAENDVERYLALAGIFVGSWLVTAWLVGAYRPVTNIGLVLTLVLAVPFAVLIRAAIVRTWTVAEIGTFAAVALLFCAVFVGAIRAAVLFTRRGGAT